MYSRLMVWYVVRMTYVKTCQMLKNSVRVEPPYVFGLHGFDALQFVLAMVYMDAEEVVRLGIDFLLPLSNDLSQTGH